MEAKLQGDNLSTMGKGKGRVSVLFLNLKKEKTMDTYRKPNVFLSDQDIIALLNIIHNGCHVDYIDMGEIRTPIVHADFLNSNSEKWATRLQGILLRLEEGLENVDTIFE